MLKNIYFVHTKSIYLTFLFEQWIVRVSQWGKRTRISNFECIQVNVPECSGSTEWGPRHYHASQAFDITLWSKFNLFGFIISWILHQIILYSNKVKWNLQLAKITILPSTPLTPFPTLLLDDRTGKCVMSSKHIDENFFPVIISTFILYSFS